jgi:hypothetical protein
MRASHVLGGMPVASMRRVWCRAPGDCLQSVSAPSRPAWRAGRVTGDAGLAHGVYAGRGTGRACDRPRPKAGERRTSTSEGPRFRCAVVNLLPTFVAGDRRAGSPAQAPKQPGSKRPSAASQVSRKRWRPSFGDSGSETGYQAPPLPVRSRSVPISVQRLIAVSETGGSAT